jgi:glycosyltransferase involved in cell wall biosynthesis
VTQLVVIDADVLGRRRTGDETHVRNLLAALPLPAAAAGLRLAAVTRRPDLVPDGIEAIELKTRLQEFRMTRTFPRLLAKLGADLVHTQYAIPWRCHCPAVVTIHDLSFEDRTQIGRLDGFVFRRVVPRAARRARLVFTVSERTRRDLVARYGLTPDRVVLTPNAVDPAFTPGRPPATSGYALAVGAVQVRKNQGAALAAAASAGLELVVAGPVKDERVAARLRADGARLVGYVDQPELVELYRGAACLVQASHVEGFGLPVLEAMACGTPVVVVDEPALVEVAAEAAVVVPERELSSGIRRCLSERDRLVQAGLARAAAFSWETTAAAAVRGYVEALAR